MNTDVCSLGWSLFTLVKRFHVFRFGAPWSVSHIKKKSLLVEFERNRAKVTCVSNGLKYREFEIFYGGVKWHWIHLWVPFRTSLNSLGPTRGSFSIIQSFRLPVGLKRLKARGRTQEMDSATHKTRPQTRQEKIINMESIWIFVVKFLATYRES